MCCKIIIVYWLQRFRKILENTFYIVALQLCNFWGVNKFVHECLENVSIFPPFFLFFRQLRPLRCKRSQVQHVNKALRCGHVYHCCVNCVDIVWKCCVMEKKFPTQISLMFKFSCVYTLQVQLCIHPQVTAPLCRCHTRLWAFKISL